MLGKLAVGATLLVLVGAPIVAESWAGHELDQSVADAVHALAPGATVTRVEPHGRPFLIALLHKEVSSAYADVRGPDGTATLILQRLHRDTGQVNRVLWLSTVPQPVPLIPSRTAGGAYSPTGTAQLDGRAVSVTYRATVGNGRVDLLPTVAGADGRPVPAGSLPPGLTPPPIQLPSVGALSVRAVSVGKDDLTVELQQTDVDVRQSPRA